MSTEQQLTTVTFIPQIWYGPKRDDAMTVEPAPGPNTWQVPIERVRGIKPRSHEADHLAREEAAPAWVREWALSHPFEVEWDEPDEDWHKALLPNDQLDPTCLVARIIQSNSGLQ